MTLGNAWYQQLVTKFTAKGYKEEKSYPNGWASASTAMACEAVPGVKRFVFLSLKVIPLVQKGFRTIVKFVETNKVRNERKGRCCFNSECGKVNNYKLTTNRYTQRGREQRPRCLVKQTPDVNQ